MPKRSDDATQYETPSKRPNVMKHSPNGQNALRHLVVQGLVFGSNLGGGDDDIHAAFRLLGENRLRIPVARQ